MVADFYYYKQLNNQEKVLYKTIYNAVLGYESEIVIKNFLCGRADIDKVHMAVINDNPHFFYYDQRHLEYVCDGMDIAVKLNYLISKVDSKKYSTIVRDKINRILHYVKPDGKSEYEKVKAIHDILSGKVQYAYDWLGCTEGMKFCMPILY